MIEFIYRILYRPAPNAEEYWKPPKISEEDKSRACEVCINEEGRAFGFNPVKQANPAWKGNNKSRIGMLYSPYFHVMGIFMQGTIKGAMLKCIDFCHSAILKYDPEAYVYEDPRLQKIESVVKDAIEELFYDELERRSFGDGTRKIRFMHRAADIGLFLMKEDIFYRYRFISLLQRIGRAVEQMEPTQDELINLKKVSKR